MAMVEAEGPWSGWKGLKNLRRLRERVGQIPKWWEKVVGHVEMYVLIQSMVFSLDPYVPESLSEREDRSVKRR